MYYFRTKKELFIVAFIFMLLVIAIAFNLKEALRKNRDFQRKADIRSLHDTLTAFHEDFGEYPAATSDGKIVACNPKVAEDDSVIYEPCNWLHDPFLTYLVSIPTDPNHNKGPRYRYISTKKHFQILAALESPKEPEYDEAILYRNINCGTEICNFGRASKDIPLDKSIEEYENELREKELREKMLRQAK